MSHLSSESEPQILESLENQCLMELLGINITLLFLSFYQIMTVEQLIKVEEQGEARECKIWSEMLN